MQNNITIVGHRGASAYLPDNTIESLEQAFREKADMVEFDVRQTRDGELVLFHDWNITTGEGLALPVASVDYGELKRQCKAEGFELARLEDVLILFGGKLKLNIELKAGGYEEATVEMVARYVDPEEVVFSSFFPWVILKLKHLDRTLRTGWIIGQEQVLFMNRLGAPFVGNLFKLCRADAAHLHYNIITRRLIDKLSHQGVPVYAWTIDDFRIASHLVEIGVEGIITNRPGDLKAYLQARQPRGDGGFGIKPRPLGQ